MWRSFGGISDSSPLNHVEFARRTPVHIPRRKVGLYPETFNPRMTEKPPRPIKLTRADLTPGSQAVGPPCAPAESRPGRCFRNDQRARGAATTASASRPRVCLILRTEMRHPIGQEARARRHGSAASQAPHSKAGPSFPRSLICLSV